MVAQGKGRFTKNSLIKVSAREEYTFLAFPNHLGLHLGFEFKDKQIILPYITAAIEYLVAFEFQNDNFKRPKFLGQLRSPCRRRIGH